MHAAAAAARAVQAAPTTSCLRRVHRRSTARSPHGQWWTAVPTDETSEALAILFANDGVRRALVATLELSVERCIERYYDEGMKEPLERWLATTLGDNLAANAGDASPFTPSGMLGKVLRETSSSHDAVAAALGAELKRRFKSRHRTLRDGHVCVTWRGKHTSLSTRSLAITLDISAALAQDEDDFAATMERIRAVDTR